MTESGNLERKGPGQFISRYELLNELGSGGMGVVFKANDPKLLKTVALKVLINENISDDQKVRFQQEAKALKDLRHHSFPEIYNFAVSRDGEPYMVLEYIEGTSLDQLISTNGRLPVLEALQLTHSLCEALAYAHGNGVFHRDIKPANIILLPDGVSTKIIDFGIAKLEQSSQDMTQTGQIVGSPRYMSPEQIRGQIIDGRSDIYSLGCVLFELLTGRPPYTGRNSLETIVKHTTEPIPSLSDFDLDIEDITTLENVTTTCLQKTPEERFQSMSNLAEAIEKALLTYADFQEESQEVEQIEPDASTPANYFGKHSKILPLTIIASIAIITTILSISIISREEETIDAPTAKSSEFANSEDDRVWSLCKQFDPVDVEAGDMIARLSKGKPKSYMSARCTDEDFRSLKKLLFRDNITGVTINSNKATGQGLVFLKGVRVESFESSSNSFDDSGLQALTGLVNLKDLTLGGTEKMTANGLKQLHKISTLKQLTIIRSTVPQGLIEAISGLEHLEHLTLDHSGIVALQDFENLAKLENTLTFLQLENTSLTSDFLPVIGRLSKLEELNLYGNNLTDKNIETISKLPLIKLSLAANPITDKTLGKLAKCRSLKDLNLHKCKYVTESGIAKLQKSLPQCKTDSR
ncbi:MAG: protein kinase [Candidatus Obscuribacterales bacterium]|nr:protein kinase [Candidatus Obscuribacterales bacterium]